MSDTLIAVARKAYHAYFNKDRATIEAFSPMAFISAAHSIIGSTVRPTLIGVGRTANGLPV
jgi:hypothetical protein